MTLVIEPGSLRKDCWLPYLQIYGLDLDNALGVYRDASSHISSTMAYPEYEVIQPILYNNS